MRRSTGTLAAVSPDPVLDAALHREFGLTAVRWVDLDIPVNDVLRVDADQGRFALKLYHRARTARAVGWEAELVEHLVGREALHRGRSGPVVELTAGGRARIGVLFDWAPGANPPPTPDTYLRLGAAAAALHRAADHFTPTDDAAREIYGPPPCWTAPRCACGR